MGSGASIRAGRAFVELYLDDSKMVRGLKVAQGRLRGFGTAVEGIGKKFLAAGGIITGALGGALKVFSDVGDALAKMSKRTGVAASALAEIGFAAEQSGASMESVEKGLKKMAATLYDAERGSSEAVDALKAIGLTVGNLKGIAPEEQFQRLAEALNGVADESTKAALAQKIFGRAGTQLLPMLPDLAALRKEARDLRLVPSDASFKAAEDVNDAFNRIHRVVKAVAFEVGAALAPAFLDLAKRVVAAAVNVIDFVRSNKDLVITVAKVGVGLSAAGAALVSLGAAAKLAALGIGGIAALATPLGAAVAALAGLSVGVAWLYKATAATADLKRETEGLAQAVQAKQQQDQQSFARLRELASAQSLSNEQFAEAKRIAESLSGQYGDLGVVFDDTARSIGEVAAATERLTKAQRVQMIEALNKQFMEANSNVQELKKSIEAKSAGGMASFWDSLKHELGGQNDDLNNLTEAEKRMREIQGQLDAARAGLPVDLGGTPPAASGATSANKPRIFGKQLENADLKKHLFGGLPAAKKKRIFDEALTGKELREGLFGGLPAKEKKPIFGNALKNLELRKHLFGGLPEQKQKLEDIGASLQREGSFSAAVASRFGGSNVMERLTKKIAATSDRGNKLLERIERKIQGPMLADNS